MSDCSRNAWKPSPKPIPKETVEDIAIQMLDILNQAADGVEVYQQDVNDFCDRLEALGVKV